MSVNNIEQKRALLALSRVPKLGLITLNRLLQEIPDPVVLAKSGPDLQEIGPLPRVFHQGLRHLADWSYADQVLRETEAAGVDLISILETEYPSRLKEIHAPPPLLWIKGNRELLQQICFAVVGTRAPSVYGKKMTRLFSEGLARMGFVIVSGLAKGVDTEAHKTALEISGQTIAVLGSGVNWIYPTANRTLAKEMLERGGLLISEFPPGTAPAREHFPIRNRTVSGMSVGVLVTESAKKGGSMITAATAREQQREVFAIPHPLQVTSGSGCNQLIRMQTAKLVQSFEDIIEELAIDIPMGTIPVLKFEESDYHHLLPVQQKILQEIGGEEMHLHTLSTKVDIPLPRLYSYLVDLEIRGHIRQGRGQMISKV